MKEEKTHHILPGESYRDYMKRHKAALQSQERQGYSGRFLLLLCKAAAAGIPVLYAGYSTAERCCGNLAVLTLCCTLLLAYVYFAAIYYIKGYIVALRQKQQPAWILLWALCKGFAGLMSTLGVHSLLQQYCSAETTTALTVQVFYWSAAAAIGATSAYSYDLVGSGAPRLVYWSYRQALKPFGQAA